MPDHYIGLSQFLEPCADMSFFSDIHSVNKVLLNFSLS